MTTPFQDARKLWSTESSGLPLNEFQSRFDAIYAVAQDLPTLWQLGGAVGDYLRLHPGAVIVPDLLPGVLLKSDHLDARIIGLKLLNRLEQPATTTVHWLAFALSSADENEVAGGLHELGEFLPRTEANTDLQPIKSALAALANSPDSYVRERAANLLTSLSGQG